MRNPANDTAALAPTFETLRVGRLTWTGLGVAVLGWTTYLGATVLSELIAASTKHPLPMAHGDLVDLAKSVIASGFALAIIGALHSGFGTLNRFFAAVLSRSMRKDTESVVSAPIERTAPTVAPISRRPYRTFADGSVEVDTIVGTRLFKNMNEARDFI